jgi:hypothetical protein
LAARSALPTRSPCTICSAIIVAPLFGIADLQPEILKLLQRFLLGVGPIQSSRSIRPRIAVRRLVTSWSIFAWIRRGSKAGHNRGRSLAHRAFGDGDAALPAFALLRLALQNFERKSKFACTKRLESKGAYRWRCGKPAMPSASGDRPLEDLGKLRNGRVLRHDHALRPVEAGSAPEGRPGEIGAAL